MFRILIVALLSLALAVPFAPGAARADSKDVAKVVGGLIALYALKELIEHEQRRTPSRRTPPVAATRQAPVAAPPASIPRQRTGSLAPARSPVPLPRAPAVDTTALPQGEVRLLPDRCFTTVDTQVERVSGYDAACMQSAVARPGSLPPDCLERLHSDAGPRTLYAPVCLRDRGWSPRTAGVDALR